MTLNELYAAANAGRFRPEQGLFEESRSKYRERQRELEDEFRSAAFEALGYEGRVSEKAWNTIYRYADEEGHSGGFSEILNVLVSLDAIVSVLL